MRDWRFHHKWMSCLKGHLHIIYCPLHFPSLASYFDSAFLLHLCSNKPADIWRMAVVCYFCMNSQLICGLQYCLCLFVCFCAYGNTVMKMKKLRELTGEETANCSNSDNDFISRSSPSESLSENNEEYFWNHQMPWVMQDFLKGKKNVWAFFILKCVVPTVYVFCWY